MGSELLATGIRKNKFMKDLYDAIVDELNTVDTTKVLIYLFDSVDVDALPVLGEQLNVMGYKGWILADTEKDKRELLKQAIELKRYAGTPYAIKKALTTLGFPDAEIVEGFNGAAYFDGAHNFNGSIDFGSLDDEWAVFKVLFDLAQFNNIDPAKYPAMIKLILTYKPARSKFLYLGFYVNFDDSLLSEDEETLTIVKTDNDYSNGILFNGDFNFDGEAEFGREDDLVLNIIS